MYTHIYMHLYFIHYLYIHYLYIHINRSVGVANFHHFFTGSVGASRACVSIYMHVYIIYCYGYIKNTIEYKEQKLLLLLQRTTVGFIFAMCAKYTQV